MKQIVLVSRRWHHPNISMVVTDDELSFVIDLVDFIRAMKQEMAATNGVGSAIDQAVESVLKGIKGESARIMG